MNRSEKGMNGDGDDVHKVQEKMDNPDFMSKATINNQWAASCRRSQCYK
jgi:hypothetical protein